ncbi:F-box/LRR-repeat protein-like protein [Tanacetum coccineum]
MIHVQTGKFVSDNVEEQTEHVLKNMGEILKASGVSYSSVVKTTIMLAKSFFDMYCIGETQFHATLSGGLSPVGPTYKAASVREKNLQHVTWLTGRIEGTNENIDGETILNQVYDEVG